MFNDMSLPGCRIVFIVIFVLIVKEIGLYTQLILALFAFFRKLGRVRGRFRGRR
jgi:hypothetical protein